MHLRDLRSCRLPCQGPLDEPVQCCSDEKTNALHLHVEQTVIVSYCLQLLAVRETLSFLLQILAGAFLLSTVIIHQLRSGRTVAPFKLVRA